MLPNEIHILISEWMMNRYKLEESARNLTNYEQSLITESAREEFAKHVDVKFWKILLKFMIKLENRTAKEDEQDSEQAILVSLSMILIYQNLFESINKVSM